MGVAMQIGLAGMDPIRFLESTDDTELDVMLAISHKYVDEQDRRDDALATRIANEVNRMLSKSMKK
jgi:hypothetical protein